MKIDTPTRDRLWRIVWRTMLPMLPGAEIYDLLKDIRTSQTAFDQQVTDAVDALRNASALISRLQEGVEERMAKLEQVRQEHDRYSELASIEAKKAEALLNQVETTMGKGQRKERWIALAMHVGVGFLFFFLGVVFSDPFKEWLNYVWTKFFH
jgi:hypothetical protein